MDDPRERKNGITPTRIGIWVVAGGIGLYLIVSGLIGALGGGRRATGRDAVGPGVFAWSA